MSRDFCGSQSVIIDAHVVDGAADNLIYNRAANGERGVVYKRRKAADESLCDKVAIGIDAQGAAIVDRGKSAPLVGGDWRREPDQIGVSKIVADKSIRKRYTRNTQTVCVGGPDRGVVFGDDVGILPRAVEVDPCADRERTAEIESGWIAADDTICVVCKEKRAARIAVAIGRWRCANDGAIQAVAAGVGSVAVEWMVRDWRLSAGMMNHG